MIFLFLSSIFHLRLDSFSFSAVSFTIRGEDWLKPLMIIQMPNAPSQKKIGAVVIPDHIVMLMPNIVKMADEMSSGAPMSPTAGIIRGTSRDRYISVPSIRAFRAGIILGPSVNVRLRTATRAFPIVTRVVALAPIALGCCRLTTASIHTTPITIVAASKRRVPTKPSAKLSFSRLTTQNSATAVPIQAKAFTRSRHAPEIT